LKKIKLACVGVWSCKFHDQKDLQEQNTKH